MLRMVRNGGASGGLVTGVSDTPESGSPEPRKRFPFTPVTTGIPPTVRSVLRTSSVQDARALVGGNMTGVSDDTKRERPLPLEKVDLRELGESLNDGSCEMAHYFDPSTGEVVMADAYGEVLGADNNPVDLEEVDWLPIERISAQKAYEDMERFTAAVGDARLRLQLQRDLEGRGAFRRFRQRIYDIPEEFGRDWNEYSQTCSGLRGLDWLEERNLVAGQEISAERTRLRGLASAVLAKVSGKAGPRLDLAQLPEAVAQLTSWLEEGRNVTLTRDGEPFAAIEPLEPPGHPK